jgi:hypothetical protein
MDGQGGSGSVIGGGAKLVSSSKGISFDQFLYNINSQILNPIIYFLFSLATIYFLYGVFVFIKNADSPDKRSEGAKSMMWGIIGLFIMLSVKGIINLILRTIGVV